jgi:F-type H+-transporting ATPase subunit delta
MLAQQVAKKYSHALFHLVREKGLVDQADTQFAEIDKLVTADRNLMQFLLAPHVLESDKVNLVKRIFEGRIEPLFLNFLFVLIEKHRIGFFHEIVEEFRALVDEAKGVAVAEVTTVVPMTDDAREQLIEKLARKTGKKIELEEKVDPSIIGGMIVKVGDQVIDGSVQYGLSELREELMKIKVA